MHIGYKVVPSKKKKKVCKKTRPSCLTSMISRACLDFTPIFLRSIWQPNPRRSYILNSCKSCFLVLGSRVEFQYAILSYSSKSMKIMTLLIRRVQVYFEISRWFEFLGPYHRPCCQMLPLGPSVFVWMRNSLTPGEVERKLFLCKTSSCQMWFFHGGWKMKQLRIFHGKRDPRIPMVARAEGSLHIVHFLFSTFHSSTLWLLKP